MPVREDMKHPTIFSVMALIGSTILLLHCIACRASVTISTDPLHEMRKQKQQKTGHKGRTEPKPTQEDVRALIGTAFGGLFEVDERITPTHLIGDFNGDGVEDIAIAVRLNRDVDKNDESKPAFNLYMPIHTGLNPEDYKAKNRLGALAYYGNRAQLVVLHGTAETSWRNSQPQQRHVLIDYPGTAPTKMSSYRGKLKPAAAGDEPKPTAPPRLVGDAILIDKVFEEDVGAVIYWDRSRYRVYPFRVR